jgi:hypothetical protein
MVRAHRGGVFGEVHKRIGMLDHPWHLSLIACVLADDEVYDEEYTVMKLQVCGVA